MNSKKVEILFSRSEGVCYGCNQSYSTNSTTQPIGMVLSEYNDGKATSKPYCYVCATKRIEQLKNDLVSTNVPNS